MNYSNYRLSLDIHDIRSNVVIKVKRGTNTKRLCISLTENGKVYEIGNSCTAEFKGKRPDGKSLSLPVEKIERNVIYYVIGTSTTKVAGVVEGEIRITSGDGKVIATPTFSILVEDTIVDDDDVIYPDEDPSTGGTGGTGGGGAAINDNVISLSSTWSSQKISEELAKLSYEPIAITSFTISPTVAEVGSKISVTLNWRFNKTPKVGSVTMNGMQTLDGISATQSSSNVSAPTNYPTSTQVSWTLKAQDSEGASATKSVSVSFYNKVYYGAASEPSSYNSDFIKSLSGQSLVGSKLSTFTVNAGAGKYIYYCLPTRYGQCSFSVGGFSGGFKLVDTISFTNASNYTENYYVYRSDNASLGNTTVNVS